MEIAHILEELAYDMGELPREAIEAAVSKRTAITPYLLDILEDAIKRIDEIIDFDNYQGHLYAMYLLAQFRERQAYPLILRLFSFPGEIPHTVAGDVLTEDLSRILASVCGDNIEPLQKFIENPAINEYVRAACQSCLVVLVGCGLKPRDQVIDYFKSLFAEKLERRPSFAWDHLVSSCCELYPQEVLTEITQAFSDNLIDRSFICLDDVNSVLSKQKEEHLSQLYQNAELIDDTVTEMEKWLSAQELKAPH